jgi:hypothetical protein
VTGEVVAGLCSALKPEIQNQHFLYIELNALAISTKNSKAQFKV